MKTVSRNILENVCVCVFPQHLAKPSYPPVSLPKHFGKAAGLEALLIFPNVSCIQALLLGIDTIKISRKNLMH